MHGGPFQPGSRRSCSPIGCVGMSSCLFTAGYLASMEQLSADVGRYVTRRLGVAQARHLTDRRQPEEDGL